MTPRKIAKHTMVLMVVTALFFDVLQWLFNFLLLAWVVDIFAALTFFVWFNLYGISFMTPKRLAAFWGTFFVELIPVIDVLPAWTVAVLYIILESKALAVVAKVPGGRFAANLALKRGLKGSAAQQAGKISEEKAREGATGPTKIASRKSGYEATRWNGREGRRRENGNAVRLSQIQEEKAQLRAELDNQTALLSRYEATLSEKQAALSRSDSAQRRHMDIVREWGSLDQNGVANASDADSESTILLFREVTELKNHIKVLQNNIAAGKSRLRELEAQHRYEEEWAA